jgi:osmotically-inducible protein OsmY
MREKIMHIKVHEHSDQADVTIAKAAERFLRWATDVPQDSITISVQQGWLTISGRVSWVSQKRAATQALRCVPGLKGISDHVDIYNCDGH